MPDQFLYRYDLGDDWEVQIQVLERDLEDSPPLLLDGEHPGPPEDCGGVSGLEELKAILPPP